MSVVWETIRVQIITTYFNDLGVNALWFSPIVEQIHGATNEGTGNTYGFHGYWTKDWTAIEPNFGTEDAFKKLEKKMRSRIQCAPKATT